MYFDKCYCKKVIGIEYDKASGLIKGKKEIDKNFSKFNKKNNCKFFKKKLFVKKQDKKYCKECIFFDEWEYPD